MHANMLGTSFFCDPLHRNLVYIIHEKVSGKALFFVSGCCIVSFSCR